MGAHHCLGAQLARMELQEAFRGLLTRLPGLRMAVPLSDIEFHHGQAIVTMRELPVTWDDVLRRRTWPLVTPGSAAFSTGYHFYLQHHSRALGARNMLADPRLTIIPGALTQDVMSAPRLERSGGAPLAEIMNSTRVSCDCER
jgi:hypothetical protein